MDDWTQEPADPAVLVRAATGDPARGCAIAIMAKASRPGVCKTRLIGPLAAEDAARLNTAFLCDMVENIAAAGRREAAHAYLAFGPAGATPFFEEHFPPGVGLIEIARPDFGECLYRTIERLLSLGHPGACVLNSDSPTLPTAVLAETARLLSLPGDRAVLGPSTDGGYYLIGLKAAHRRLFENIAWSTELVAAQTRARAAEIGLPLVELAPWYDVDDEDGLHRLSADLAEGSSAEGAYAAPHTAGLLPQLTWRGRAANRARAA